MTKKAIGSIIFVAYQEYIDFEKMKKDALLARINLYIEKNPQSLETLQNYTFDEGTTTVQTAVTELMMENGNNTTTVQLTYVEEVDISNEGGLPSADV